MRNSSHSEDQKVTAAFTENKISTNDGGNCRGYIAVVGIGPGHAAELTPRAHDAIRDAEIVVGYHTYMKLIDDLISDKEQVGTGMRAF